MERLIDKDEKIIVGIMSGTSLDGIDVSIAKFSGHGKSTKIELIDFNEYSYDPKIKDALLKLTNNNGDIADVCYYNVLLGKLYGDCAKDLMDRNHLSKDDVDVICSHGQTIFHMPEKGATLQIGDINMIAAKTGVMTIGDFRMADMAAGGHGAPLAPFYDYMMLSSATEDRVVVNIGGISNLTILNKDCAQNEIVAFDCGPGNMIMDRVIAELTDGKKTFDDQGEMASKGTVNKGLIEWMLSLDDFIKQAPPKTTGRELYNEEFISKIVNYIRKEAIELEDAMATVTSYTAKAIDYNLKSFGRKDTAYVLYIGGGGARNQTLMKYLKDETGFEIHTMEKLGVDSGSKEALIFSMLGNELISGYHNNLKSATGAEYDALMGKIAFPHRQ